MCDLTRFASLGLVDQPQYAGVTLLFMPPLLVPFNISNIGRGENKKLTHFVHPVSHIRRPDAVGRHTKSDDPPGHPHIPFKLPEHIIGRAGAYIISGPGAGKPRTLDRDVASRGSLACAPILARMGSH